MDTYAIDLLNRAANGNLDATEEDKQKFAASLRSMMDAGYYPVYDNGTPRFKASNKYPKKLDILRLNFDAIVESTFQTEKDSR